MNEQEQLVLLVGIYRELVEKYSTILQAILVDLEKFER